MNGTVICPYIWLLSSNPGFDLAIQSGLESTLNSRS